MEYLLSCEGIIRSIAVSSLHAPKSDLSSATEAVRPTELGTVEESLMEINDENKVGECKRGLYHTM